MKAEVYVVRKYNCARARLKDKFRVSGSSGDRVALSLRFFTWLFHISFYTNFSNFCETGGSPTLTTPAVRFLSRRDALSLIAQQQSGECSPEIGIENASEAREVRESKIREIVRRRYWAKPFRGEGFPWRKSCDWIRIEDIRRKREGEREGGKRIQSGVCVSVYVREKRGQVAGKAKSVGKFHTRISGMRKRDYINLKMF